MPTFAWTLDDKPLDQVLEEKSHPVLRQDHKVKQNLLSTEIETAHKWGYIPDLTNTTRERNWFDIPRETRAVLVANEQLKSLTAQIEIWDEKQKLANRKGSK